MTVGIFLYHGIQFHEMEVSIKLIFVCKQGYIYECEWLS